MVKTQTPVTLADQELLSKSSGRVRSQWSMAARELRKNRAAVLGLIVLVIIVIFAIFAPFITPYDPIEINPPDQFASPGMSGELLGWAADDSPVYSTPHYMGADHLGRDIFSRVLYGARVSLQVAIITNVIAIVVGAILGLISGYAGGGTDFFIQRGVDILYAFPSILLALTVIAITGPGLYNIMFAMGIAWIPVYTRLIRGSVLSAKQAVYVEAARSTGAKHTRILSKHIFPNISSSIIVLGSMNIGTAILTAAALSFIGLGVQRPDPEWGVILNEGRRYMTQAPWMTFFPGAAIAITVLAVNMFGDGLRTALDPRMTIE